jgi:hypothetical protein
MAIAYLLKKTLFELRPDILPAFMTDVEQELWGMFLEDMREGK